MDETQLETLRRLPTPESCRIIDFDSADLITLESFPPQFHLVVSGTKPSVSMRVDLVPRIHIRQPEYWGIEVVGCLPGISLPVLAPYSVSLPLAGVTGTRGIEVIGANQSVKIDVPPADVRQPVGSFELTIASPNGEVRASATLTCGPAGGTHPDPQAACAQLIDADGRIEKIPEKEGICTQQFEPVVLRAHGTWNGEPREFEAEFGNPCFGILATGGVIFDLE